MFQRTISKRFADFQEALSKTVEAVANGHNEARKVIVQELYRCCKDLGDLLTPKDQPIWLLPILHAANGFLRTQDQRTSKELLDALLRHFRLIEPITLSDDDGQLLDFDALYVQIRDQGRTPELFDKLIELLERMIASGEIDSIGVEQALLHVLATLRANRKGSYVAVRQSISVAKYVKHLTRACLAKVPGIGEMLEAWDRMMEEVESEFAKTDLALRQHIQAGLMQSIPRLSKLSSGSNDLLIDVSSPEDVVASNFVPLIPDLRDVEQTDRSDTQ